MTDKNYDMDDGLTDEEREALNDEDTIVAEADPATGDDNDIEEEAAAGDDPADDKADTNAAAAAEPAAAAAPESTSEDKPQQAPILVAPSIEDADGKLSAIATQKESLLTQFDDGDITAREFQKAMDELNKQERQIELDVREAQLAAKMEAQRAQNEWIDTCNAFLESNPVYKDNVRLYRALDAEVKELAQKPETANWSGAKFLAEAHKALAEAFNLPAANAPTNKQRRTDNLPPNLAKVPAADVNDTDGGRFAVLDRLAATDPIAYEDALAKMPEAERNAYMAAG